MRLSKLFAVCVLGFSANAFATSFDSLDLFYVTGETEVSPAGAASTSEDGNGYGVKFRGSVGEEFFFSGEYQSIEGEDTDGDYTEWRGGFGVPFLQVNALTAYGLVEYVNAEFENLGLETDGIAGHVGALYSPTPWLSLYGQLGYMGLQDADGIEYLVGGAVQLKPWVGVFAEYRVNDLDVSDADADLELKAIRAGIYLVVQ